MRALVLTQVVPHPPDSGPKVKTHYALRTIAEEHTVELVTFARGPAEAKAAREIERWLGPVTVVPLRRRRIHEPYYLARGWGRGTPFLVARDERAAMVRAVRERLATGGIDVLHADQLSMAQYLALARGTSTATVFDAHNAVWELVRDLARRQPTPVHRLAAEIEWRLLRRYEGAICRGSDITLTVSEHDRAALTRAAGVPIRTAMIPIGVEVEETPFAPPPVDAAGILSVATMFYPPNAEALRWFRDEVWPLLRERSLSARVDVVGSRPPDDMVAWGRADDRVRVHGYVESLDEVYRGAAVFIVPLRSGSGVRVKILEAMARGVPVVSTSVGVSGLDLHDGRHLLVADSPRDFAQAVSRLLASPDLRLTLARAARACVLERYDWRPCCRPLREVYSRLAARDRSSLADPALSARFEA